MIETQTKRKSNETFPCFYRKDVLCTFWEQAEADNQAPVTVDTPALK